ncbi:MAG: DUF2892 domain-containing protein [Candidatus Marinimicrobia bacterium]|nr:DUF2892 domain-containing protein [Candidatus Neomarinimicrobiota bacterium]
MKCNVGKTDKILRIVIGLSIIGLGLFLKSWWGLLGIVPLLTALCNTCPLYLPFGISTCKKK